MTRRALVANGLGTGRSVVFNCACATRVRRLGNDVELLELVEADHRRLIHTPPPVSARVAEALETRTALASRS